MLGFLRRASDPRFNLQVKRTLYLSLVRFLLGYASEVWTPLSARGLQSVEGIQRCATKVTLKPPSASLPYNERLLKLKLLPISYCHELNDLVFFFEAVNRHYNIDITKFIQPNVIVRSTRNSSFLDFLIPKCKTSTFQKVTLSAQWSSGIRYHVLPDPSLQWPPSKLHSITTTGLRWQPPLTPIACPLGNLYASNVTLLVTWQNSANVVTEYFIKLVLTRTAILL